MGMPSVDGYANRGGAGARKERFGMKQPTENPFVTSARFPDPVQAEAIILEIAKNGRVLDLADPDGFLQSRVPRMTADSVLIQGALRGVLLIEMIQVAFIAGVELGVLWAARSDEVKELKRMAARDAGKENVDAPND